MMEAETKQMKKMFVREYSFDQLYFYTYHGIQSLHFSPVLIFFFANALFFFFGQQHHRHILQTQLHDLYVRYTMNPFSRLRSPICSIKFDDGVISLARSFNGMVGGGGLGVVGSPKSSSSSSAATQKGTSGGDSPTTDGEEGRKANEEDGLSWV